MIDCATAMRLRFAHAMHRIFEGLHPTHIGTRRAWFEGDMKTKRKCIDDFRVPRAIDVMICQQLRARIDDGGESRIADRLNDDEEAFRSQTQLDRGDDDVVVAARPRRMPSCRSNRFGVSACGKDGLDKRLDTVANRASCRIHTRLSSATQTNPTRPPAHIEPYV